MPISIFILKKWMECCFVHGYVEEEVIRSILMHKEIDPSLRARMLLKKALDAGGYDNITVILIDTDGEC